MLKILHTSDIHLGAKFSFLGEKASSYRQALVAVFERIITKAIEQKVQLLIISGDLFDSPYPSKTNVEIVSNGLKKLNSNGIYVAILPGNHDYLASSSVFNTQIVSSQDQKLIVFNDEKKEKIVISDLDLTLYAKVKNLKDTKASLLPQKTIVDSPDPLPQAEGISTARSNTSFHVAIAHGNLDISKNKVQKNLIAPEEIANSGFDYIALGDWHGFLEVSQNQVQAFYPGSPEPLNSDQRNAGKIIIVELEKGVQARVKSLGIGNYGIIDIEVDIANSRENLVKDIEKNILEKTGNDKLENLIVNVTIIGQRNPEQVIEKGEIEEYFSSKIFSFKIIDRTELRLDAENIAKYTDHSITGKFIKYLQDKKDAPPDIIQEAISKGINELLATSN